MLRALLILAAVCASQAQLCSYSDVVGVWSFQESARTGNSSLVCSGDEEVVYEKTITLTYPDVATDELGNVGTWTIIFDYGYEVRINERSYFGYFHWSLLEGIDCGSIVTNTVRDSTVRHWSCFTATKVDSKSELKPITRPVPAPENADELFQNDMKLIDGINSAHSSWSAKAYPEYEKYTVGDMQKRGNAMQMRVPPVAPATEDIKAKAALLPTSFDWRDYNGVDYVSPIRDQASCGSCWAFASGAMLESRIRIMTNFSRSDIFSTQELVNCSPYTDGCSGGWPYLIGRYAMEQGVVDEECVPYLGEDAVCDTDPTCGRTYVSDYSYVGGFFGNGNEENMIIELLENGPFMTCYNVMDDFYYYEDGIYVATEQAKADFDPFSSVNHVVTVVGYGVEEETGMKYWIVKNSWGVFWGERGFFRIRRGTNEASIEAGPISLTVIP